MMPNLFDRADPAVIKALTRTCGCCHAAKGVDCHLLNTDQPLPGGQIVHHHRAEKGIVAP